MCPGCRTLNELLLLPWSSPPLQRIVYPQPSSGLPCLTPRMFAHLWEPPSTERSFPTTRMGAFRTMNSLSPGDTISCIRGISPAYADSSSGSLTDSPGPGVSGGTFIPAFETSICFWQLEAIPVPVLWYTALCLHSALNPVPSSTFSHGVFSNMAIVLLFPAGLPPLPFFAASTDSLP